MKHKYSAYQNLETILITTESLTYFGGSIDYTNLYGSPKELRSGNCAELERINCEGGWGISNDAALGNLTTLIVSSGCTALSFIDCQGNQLSASALNDLFNSLPTTEDGEIQTFGNPGNSTCDNSIAKKKGWYFYP